MNVSAKQKNVNWKKIGLIAVVLLVVGYGAARPKLEKWLNMDLPSLTNQDDGHRDDRGNNDDQYNAQLPNQNSGSNASSKSEDEFFASISGDRKTSPAGLVYTMGPRREHRVEHVMNHRKDNTSKPAHGVFEGSRLDVLQLIDEAYEVVKAGSNRVVSENSSGKKTHVVDMNRNVGYDGGAKGKRNGHKKLGKVKLVLDGNRVITAFPHR